MLSEFLNLITSIYCSSCYWIRNNEVRNCHLSSSNFKTKYRLKLLFTISSKSIEFEPLSLASFAGLLLDPFSSRRIFGCHNLLLFGFKIYFDECRRNSIRYSTTRYSIRNKKIVRIDVIRVLKKGQLSGFSQSRQRERERELQNSTSFTVSRSTIPALFDLSSNFLCRTVHPPMCLSFD